MKRMMSGLAVVALVLLGPLPASALDIVTTTTDLAAITRSVGGEAVTVTSISRGVQDPHYIEAKPSFIRQVSKADLLIYNGLELEVGWLPLLLQGARNRKLTVGSPGLLDASVGIAPLEVPTGELDRSMGDVHPFGNPHYLLDPRNGILVANTIADRLSELDPSHAEQYENNAQAFTKDLNEHIAAWEASLSYLRGARFIAYHKTWEYLADWLGFEILEYVEEKPGIPPGPRHITRVVEIVQANAIPAILVATYNPQAKANTIAKRSGAPVLALPAAVRADQLINTYSDLFDAIAHRLETVGNRRAQ